MILGIDHPSAWSIHLACLSAGAQRNEQNLVGKISSGGLRMSATNTFSQGFFNWVNLSTTDTQGAEDFYNDIFGWEPHDRPTGPNSAYTMMYLGDKAAAALSGMDSKLRELSVPPHWLCSIAVDSCDAVAEKVAACGGRLAGGPFDASDLGRIAICCDPTGAHFAIWEARKHHGAAVIHQPGAMSWHELVSNDSTTSQAFFEKVFGWVAQSQRMGPMDYTIFSLNSVRVAGMSSMPGHFPTIPSYWMVYFSVDDCEQSTQQVRERGGRILAWPMGLSGLGRFSVVEDPQHAIFGIISYNRSQS